MYFVFNWHICILLCLHMYARQMRLNDEVIADLLRQLRPDVIAIVDAFDVPDNVLNSTLG